MTLRTRLLLALMATSAVTLAVAALALLPPLQDRLRDESRESVRSTVLAARSEIQAAVDRDGGNGAQSFEVLSKLADRTGARVALYPSVIDLSRPDPALFDSGSGPMPMSEVFRVLVNGGRTVVNSTDDGTRMAIPLPVTRPRFVLAVQRPDTESGLAASVVRSAFLKAALAGLAVAALLGVVLAATLSRRLGRLRRSALELASDVNAPPPTDRGADEVGDLARALASMQRALRRQEEARRAFVATASHELRTPITSMQGNLELLAEDLDAGRLDVDEAKDQIRALQQQLQRLAKLASELLDLSRLDAGIELRREPVELVELSRAVAAEFALRARERGVTIEVAQAPGPVWAGGDPGAVARILRILIDNALRFSPEGESIRVVPAYHGDRATLEVSDRGPGVPPEERELIFERFQRGSESGGDGGFGLGLAIGRELARRQGGELALAVDDGDGGARFVCELPIEMPRGATGDDDDAAHAASSDNAAAGRPAG